ncbi:MAG: hypothetical protein EZS28_053235, partial [Streblomastix strix]
RENSQKREESLWSLEGISHLIKDERRERNWTELWGDGTAPEYWPQQEDIEEEVKLIIDEEFQQQKKQQGKEDKQNNIDVLNDNQEQNEDQR